MTCTHDDGPRHNCQYVDRINRLIPQAAREADAETAIVFGARWAVEGNRYYFQARDYWDITYHDTMRKLAQAAGVRVL